MSERSAAKPRGSQWTRWTRGLRRRPLRTLGWLMLAAPGLAQLGLLLYAVASRFGYPYDLEWMEGGLLLHADRLAAGDGLYAPPSVDFIPYLYTPLYPALLAALGALVGLSYQLGRALSIASIGIILWVIASQVVRHSDTRDRGSAWVGAALAAGFVAATYPWLEGWYDLVRADTLFVAMVLAGLAPLAGWARRGDGWRGHGRVAVCAAALALAFFCKQTGVIYVAVGGAAVAALSWRRLPVYIAVAGVTGLGGTWILNRASDGWFWTYVYEVHQVHDFNMDRFWASFGHILGEFPMLSLTVGAALFAVAVTWIATRRRPRSSAALLFWTPVFAASCVVGALGWGTQWAHFNAYMPAMITGALAAGAAIPSLCGCAAAWIERAADQRDREGDDERPDDSRDTPRRSDSRTAWAAAAPGVVAAAALGAALLAAWWSPAKLIPDARDRRAGDALIAHIERIDGEVFMPFHPWYPRLAGKDRLYTHRMGIMDVTYANRWRVAGLREALSEARFAAIILDRNPPGSEFPGLTRAYRLDEILPGELSPRTVTGAPTRPRALWRPVDEPAPPGSRPLFDFESGAFNQWTIDGTAWGRRPVTRSRPKQGAVSGYRGRYFATSMHGGDAATGTLRSPPFRIDGSRITFRLGGGADPAALRAELQIAGQVVRNATNERPGERLTERSWDVADLIGQTAQIALIDVATGSWGHLNADDFLMWDSPPGPDR